MTQISTQQATLARTEAQRAETSYLIEEYEMLLGTAPPHAIAARMGYDKPSSLARRFYRFGRLDLARGLWAHETRRRRAAA